MFGNRLFQIVVHSLLCFGCGLAVFGQEPDKPKDRSAESSLRTDHLSSSRQAGETEIRILLPGSLREGERIPTVYLLPVEAGRENRYGDPIEEVLKFNLHEHYRAAFAAPTFAQLPWYADHPSDARIAQESYFLDEVLPWMEQHYPVKTDRQGRLLLGFSKSGWGAWSLLLRHPDKFERAAAWDAPMMMQQVGLYGNRPIFGSQENFERYRVTDLLKQRGSTLGEHPRLILTGMGNFEAEHRQVHDLLDQLKIPHVYEDKGRRKHDWHSGWVAEAVDHLLMR